MKNIRFEILNEYFERKVEQNKDRQAEALSIDEKLERVFKDQNVSEDVVSVVYEVMSENYNFILDVLSNCPFLKIEVSNLNDILVKFD